MLFEEREGILLKLKMVEREKEKVQVLPFGTFFVLLVLFLLWDGF